jgi:predicted ABC-type ATPase
MPEAIILGGPNGAGKTSWALRHLRPTLGISEFVNADEIARGLSPLNAEGAAFAAGRLLVERIHTLADAGQSFAFETTCAGRGHIRLFERFRAKHYRITLIFLWLPSVEAAIARVARRVSEGGHGIPDLIVARRYAAGIRNMRRLYLPLVDIGLIYDNSDEGGLLIAEHSLSSSIIVHDRIRWSQIEEATR